MKLGNAPPCAMRLVSRMVCVQNVYLIIVLLYFYSYLLMICAPVESPGKEKLGNIIWNLIKTSIAHLLKCLFVPQSNSITSYWALRSLVFHINLISNAQDLLISQLWIHNYTSKPSFYIIPRSKYKPSM